MSNVKREFIRNSFQTAVNVIAREIVSGTIGEDDLDVGLPELILSYVKKLDRMIEDDLSGQMLNMLDCCGPMLDKMHEIVTVCDSPFCYRGCFFAAFYDTKKQRLVTPIAHTQKLNPAGLECELRDDQGRKTCIRQETGRRYTDYYGNCSSVHAAQHLTVPDDCDPDSIVWIEGGVLVNDDGSYRYVAKNPDSSNPKEMLYRCSMCLRHCLSQKVTKLAHLVYEPESKKPKLYFGDVEAHLAALILLNAAEDKVQHEKDA